MGTPTDQKLEDALERLTAMVGDRGETWDLSPNDREAIKLVLERCGAAIEAEPPVGGTLGLDGDTKRDWETDGPALEKRVKELEAAAPLPTAREPQVFGWNIEQILVYIWQCMSEGDDEEANPWPFSTFSVSPMAARLRSEIAALAAPQPVSEGRLREARVLPIQWRNIADAKPSSFEFATRDDAFRYCADELERALESA